MSIAWIRKPALLGVGLSATLAAALAGCGDQTADKDNAVVVPDPNAVVHSNTPATSAGVRSGGRSLNSCHGSVLSSALTRLPSVPAASHQGAAYLGYD